MQKSILEEYKKVAIVSNLDIKTMICVYDVLNLHDGLVDFMKSLTENIYATLPSISDFCDVLMYAVNSQNGHKLVEIMSKFLFVKIDDKKLKFGHRELLETKVVT